MRHKFLLFAIITTSLNLHSQIDSNWLVRNGKGKSTYADGSIHYNVPTSGTIQPTDNINVLGLVNNNDDDPTGPMVDQYFAIFSDGSHDLLSVSNPSSGNLVINPNGRQIKYMYLSDLYHDDDPPEGINVTTIGASPPAHYFDGFNFSEPLNMVHSIVVDKDIIFIVNNTIGTNLTLECITPGIMFDPSPFNDIDYILEQYPNQNTNILNAYASVGNSPMQSTNTFQLGSQSRYYINLRINEDNSTQLYNIEEGDSSLVEIISFELKNGDRTIHTVHSTASLHYHDPNFVQVQCVWEECGEYWVRYRVQCYNDGTGSVESLVMELELPAAVDPNSISIQDYMAGCQQGCGDLRTTNQDYSQNTLRVLLPKTLDQNSCVPYNHTLSGFSDSVDECCYTAWFEFCARVNVPPSETIHTVDLQPSTPETYFESDMYEIREFIDPKSCNCYNKEGECVEWVRTSDTNCGDCSCKNCWFLDWFKCLFK